MLLYMYIKLRFLLIYSAMEMEKQQVKVLQGGVCNLWSKPG